MPNGLRLCVFLCLIYRSEVLLIQNISYALNFRMPGLSDLSYARNFHTVTDRCKFSDLLCTFCMHFIFIQKPPRMEYTKIACIRNILDFQQFHDFSVDSQTPSTDMANFNGSLICHPWSTFALPGNVLALPLSQLSSQLTLLLITRRRCFELNKSTPSGVKVSLTSSSRLVSNTSSCVRTSSEVENLKPGKSENEDQPNFKPVSLKVVEKKLWALSRCTLHQERPLIADRSCTLTVVFFKSSGSSQTRTHTAHNQSLKTNHPVLLNNPWYAGWTTTTRFQSLHMRTTTWAYTCMRIRWKVNK